MKIKWLIIGLAVLLFVGIRLWGLTASCLWFDEIFTVHAAQHPWNELFGFVSQDLIHPPLFYILLKIWISIGGESLLWLRIFPVLFASLTLLPLILLCRELKFSTLETTSTILLLAVNGAMIKYAQEVRMYSLLVCLTTFSIWLFVRSVKRENISIWPLFIVNLLLVYTHYFGWLVVLTELIIILWLRRSQLKWLAMTGVWALSFLPWVYAVLTAYKQNSGLEQNLNWAGKPGGKLLLQFFAGLHQPFYFQQSNADPWISLFALPIFLVVVLAFVFLVVFAVNGEEAREPIIILALFCTLPLMIAFVVSWVSPFSIWGTRHLTVIFVPYFLLVAWGLRTVFPDALRSLGYALILAAVVPAFIVQAQKRQPLFSWCAWEPLAAQVGDSENTTVYVFEDAVSYELWFALERRAKGKFQVKLVEDTPDIPEDKAYFLPRGFDDIQKVREQDITGDKFWVAVRGIGRDQNHSMWKRLIMRGYVIKAPLTFDATDSTVYLVPVEKEN